MLANQGHKPQTSLVLGRGCCGDVPGGLGLVQVQPLTSADLRGFMVVQN